MIMTGCPAVVVTSIADKLPLLLTNDLPSNKSVRACTELQYLHVVIGQ